MATRRSHIRFPRYSPGEPASVLRDSGRLNAPLDEIERISRELANRTDDKAPITGIFAIAKTTGVPTDGKYAWRQVQENDDGDDWEDKPEGLSGTASVNWARPLDPDAADVEEDTPVLMLFVAKGDTVSRWFLPMGGSVQLGTLFAVNVSQNGGSNGTSAAAATYTYNVTDLDGVSLGTAMSVTTPRYAKGPVTAATLGMGYYNAAGTFVLYTVFEIHGSGTC